MPGHNHRPSRANTSVKGLVKQRTLSGQMERRRSAESDLRPGQIVGAYGKGYSIVVNPGGTQRYIVRNQAGNRTWAPGAQVMIGSFSAMPGEAILGGPPAGNEGGSTFGGRSRRPGPYNPTTPLEENVHYHAITYVAGYDGVALARHLVSSDVLQITTIAASQLPHTDATLEAVRYAEEMPGSSVDVAWMVALPAQRVAICFTYQEAGSIANTYIFYTRIIDLASGDVELELTRDGKSNVTATTSFGILHGDSIYGLEPTPTPTTSGPPFEAGYQIVKRDAATLEIQSTHDWPNDASFDSRTTQSWEIISLNVVGDELIVHFKHRKTSPFNNKFYYRAFDLDLSPVGAFTVPPIVVADWSPAGNEGQLFPNSMSTGDPDAWVIFGTEIATVSLSDYSSELYGSAADEEWNEMEGPFGCVLPDGSIAGIHTEFDVDPSTDQKTFVLTGELDFLPAP